MRSPTMRSPGTTREWPPLATTREKPVQQQRPSTAENKALNSVQNAAGKGKRRNTHFKSLKKTAIKSRTLRKLYKNQRRHMYTYG